MEEGLTQFGERFWRWRIGAVLPELGVDDRGVEWGMRQLGASFQIYL